MPKEVHYVLLNLMSECELRRSETSWNTYTLDGTMHEQLKEENDWDILVSLDLSYDHWNRKEVYSKSKYDEVILYEPYSKNFKTALPYTCSTFTWIFHGDDTTNNNIDLFLSFQKRWRNLGRIK